MLKHIIEKVKCMVKKPEKQDIEVFQSFPINDTYENEVLKDIELICNKLNIKPESIDKDGYEFRIRAATFDGNDKYAYLQSKEKEKGNFIDIEYRFKAFQEKEEIINWIPKTYNPVFGCTPTFFKWYGEQLIIIYDEKHDTYIASLSKNNNIVLKEISPYWIINENKIEYHLFDSRNILTLKLPDLD